MPETALAVQEEAIQKRETFSELVRKMEFLFEVSETSEDEAEKRYALQELDALLLTDMPRKVDGICWFLGHCEMEARYAEQVIERLKDAMERHKNRQQRVRDYCRQAMQTAGLRRIQGTWQALALRAGSKSVEIVNETELPGEFWKQNPAPPPYPDKLRIRKAIEGGEAVPGAELRTGPESLVVK